MKINQFGDNLIAGETISNEILRFQSYFIKEGYDANVFADKIDETLKNRVYNLSKFNGNEDDVLIIHHSMGFDSFDKIIRLPGRKILVYHNIKPEQFFDDELSKKQVRKGLKQTIDYIPYIDLAFADSNYSRKEMLAMGYKHVDVLPTKVTFSRFDDIAFDESLDGVLRNDINIIYVGNIEKCKRQLDIIESFKLYHTFFNNKSKLYLIGDTSNKEYLEEVSKKIEIADLKNNIILPGVVNESSLKTYYKNASVFLCESEYDGYGVALLEAMKMGVPVVAFDSNTISETVNSGGLIIDKKDSSLIAALIDEIVTDNNLKEKMIAAGKERLKAIEKFDSPSLLLNSIKHLVKNEDIKESLQLQGSFETSYSLSQVNRKLIEALSKRNNYETSIYATEGPGDYTPSEKNLRDKPLAKSLYEKSSKYPYPDITIRNMYPPRVKDANGGYNFLYFFWEESCMPKEYVESFNNSLSAIAAASSYVKKVLIENGITIPIKTVGCGVDLPANYDKLKPYPLKSKKSIKFLHISSAFPRKGVDVLLKAYYEAFNKDDDVVLVLKTFPNIHNKTNEQLTLLNSEYPNHPEVEWIDCDLSSDALYSLYKMASCYVHVARGEGFGLPVAEAMLAKVPTIVANNSSLSEFCKDNTCLCVGFDKDVARTHFSESVNSVSTWFEPRLNELIDRLKYFVANKDSKQISDMISNAYSLITNEFSWDKVASNFESFIAEIKANKKKHNVAMVTTWNSKCGIAEFTKMQVDSSRWGATYEIFPNKVDDLLKEDEGCVRKRVWSSVDDKNLNELTSSIVDCFSNIIHVQFHFSFYSLSNLSYLINTCVKNKKKVIVQFHSTKDVIFNNKVTSLKSIRSSLNKCSALIVHQQADKDYLVSLGINCDLISVIPLGQIITPYVSAALVQKKRNLDSSHIVGSYGFLLPHKGVLETIRAIAMLKKEYPDIKYLACCSLYNNPISNEYYEQCKEEIEKLGLRNNVILNTTYLSNDEALYYLGCANVNVLAYHHTQESASGAVRFVASTLRPLITTKETIFDEYKECSIRIDKSEPELIANAIKQVFENEQEQLINKLKEHVYETSWFEVSKKIIDLYRKIS